MKVGGFLQLTRVADPARSGVLKSLVVQEARVAGEPRGPSADPSSVAIGTFHRKNSALKKW